MEKLWNNLKNGLCDYCRENGFNDVILGLSGGLDSAMAAVLAADALGGSHVHAIMMKTKYTSGLSLRIAAQIVELNGLDYKELDIQPVIDAQRDFLSVAMEEEPKNIVMENLQARERGKTLMTFSNQFGYLVLACGNKSEILTGYCTLYGDTCGGLAPLANIYKSDLFELARWRNKQKKALPDEVIDRAPSAELSPGQKDEDSLPPYPVLDAILAGYHDRKETAAELLASGFNEADIEKVIRLYRKSAFKRRQLAPGLETA